jgi:hypothetical protein
LGAPSTTDPVIGIPLTGEEKRRGVEIAVHGEKPPRRVSTSGNAKPIRVVNGDDPYRFSSFW